MDSEILKYIEMFLFEADFSNNFDGEMKGQIYMEYGFKVIPSKLIGFGSFYALNIIEMQFQQVKN